MLWVLDLIGRGETALEVGRESDVELAILCGRCVDEPAGGGGFLCHWVDFEPSATCAILVFFGSSRRSWVAYQTMNESMSRPSDRKLVRLRIMAAKL